MRYAVHIRTIWFLPIASIIASMAFVIVDEILQSPQWITILVLGAVTLSVWALSSARRHSLSFEDGWLDFGGFHIDAEEISTICIQPHAYNFTVFLRDEGRSPLSISYISEEHDDFIYDLRNWAWHNNVEIQRGSTTIGSAATPS